MVLIYSENDLFLTAVIVAGKRGSHLFISSSHQSMHHQLYTRGNPERLYTLDNLGRLYTRGNLERWYTRGNLERWYTRGNLERLHTRGNPVVDQLQTAK